MLDSDVYCLYWEVWSEQLKHLCLTIEGSSGEGGVNIAKYKVFLWHLLQGLKIGPIQDSSSKFASTKSFFDFPTSLDTSDKAFPHELQESPVYILQQLIQKLIPYKILTLINLDKSTKHLINC